MSLNIIDLIKGQLGAGLVSQVATKLGESESGIAKAISGLLPSVLGGLIEQSKDASVLDGILESSKSGLLGNLLEGSNSPLVSGIVSKIFGDKANGIIEAISSFSGIGSGSVSSLLNLVTGATVGSVGKFALDNNLDKSNISSLLESQKDSISGLVPSGLSLGALGFGSFLGNSDNGSVIDTVVDSAKDLLGSAENTLDSAIDTAKDSASAVAGAVGAAAGSAVDSISSVIDSAKDTVGFVADNVADTASSAINTAKDSVSAAAGAVGSAASSAVDSVENATKNGGLGSILKWILPLALLLFAGWYLFKMSKDKAADALNSNNSAVVDSTNANGSENDTLSTSGLTTTLEEIEFNGTKLKGLSGGLEQQLIGFLKDGSYANATNEQLKEKWFTFDNVKFVFGKSDEITQESQGQLQNLATILKAYPDAKIKIGGYTDKKGNDEGNLKLSQVRADFIKAELTKLGVGSQIVAAEGYGEKFATVDENASDEEREADRKMSIRFEK